MPSLYQGQCDNCDWSARPLNLVVTREQINAAFPKAMPIPDAESAFIPPEKLRDYLLNLAHPVGGPKARWFISLGYHSDSPDQKSENE